MLNNIKLGYSPLDDTIYLYRHGKDIRVALDRRKAESDVVASLVEKMMCGAPKGSKMVVTLGEKQYRITVEPVEKESKQGEK